MSKIVKPSIQYERIPTKDGKAFLDIQLDRSGKSDVSERFVIFVPGSGLFDRHVLFGTSNSKNDFLFDKLCHEFLKSDFSVVRFDNRGVFGNLRDDALDEGDPYKKSELFYNELIDSSVRLSVTPKTQIDDIVSVFDYVKSRFQNNKIYFLGHSEGCMSIMRALSQYQLNCQDIIFISPLFTSPEECMKWQKIYRLVDGIKEFNKENHRISIKNIRDQFGKSKLSSIYTINQILPSKGFWDSYSLKTLEENMVESYEEEKSWVLSINDETPWPEGPPKIVSSYAWWKQWFLDGDPVLMNIRNIKSKVHCFFGTLDTQINYQDQVDYCNSLGSTMNTTIDIQIVKGVGHSLGYDGLRGPISSNSLRRIRETLKGIE